jgi:hypothetical protein
MRIADQQSISTKNTFLNETQKHVLCEAVCVGEWNTRPPLKHSPQGCWYGWPKPVQIGTWEELISPLMGPVDINEHVSKDSTTKGINRKIGAGSKDKESMEAAWLEISTYLIKPTCQRYFLLKIWRTQNQRVVSWYSSWRVIRILYSEVIV